MSESTARRRRCTHCGLRPTWQYLETDESRWIGFCGRCGWIGRARAAPQPDLPTAITIISEAGGPGGERVPNPWMGISTLAVEAAPDVAWEPVDRPCRACALTAVVSGVREGPEQRYAFELCLECGEVIVERSLTATPELVRLDVGNVGRGPTSMGVRWLVRGLGL